MAYDINVCSDKTSCSNREYGHTGNKYQLKSNKNSSKCNFYFGIQNSRCLTKEFKQFTTWSCNTKTFKANHIHIFFPMSFSRYLEELIGRNNRVLGWINYGLRAYNSYHVRLTITKPNNNERSV